MSLIPWHRVTLFKTISVSKRLELCASCPSKYKISLCDNIPIFQNPLKYTQFFRILIKSKPIAMFCCIGTPLYIICWILLLLNLHFKWLTPRANLSLMFIHCIVLGRTLQNPTSAVFTFMWRVYVSKFFCCFLIFLWLTLHNLSFAGFELQVRQMCDGSRGKIGPLRHLYIPKLYCKCACQWWLQSDDMIVEYLWNAENVKDIWQVTSSWHHQSMKKVNCCIFANFSHLFCATLWRIVA